MTWPKHGRAPGAIARTSRVALRPLTPADYDFAVTLLLDPLSGGRLGRYGAATPSPERVAATLWDHVLAQFVVVSCRSGEAQGLTIIGAPDFQNRFAYFSLIGVPSRTSRFLTFEGAIVALEHAFRTWDFRKIYIEVSESNLLQFASVERYAELEGRYRRHLYVDGAYQDVLVFALYRERWTEQVSPRLRRRLLPIETSGE